MASKQPKGSGDVTNVSGLADAIGDFDIPFDPGMFGGEGEAEVGAADNFTAEQKEAMARGESLEKILGQQEAPEAAAPAARPEGEREASSSKGKDGGISHERIAELRESSKSLPSEKVAEFYKLFDEWWDLTLKRNTKRKQKATVEKAGEIIGASYDETLEMFKRYKQNRYYRSDRKPAGGSGKRGQEKAAEPDKVEEAKEAPAAVEPAKLEEAKETPVSAEPVKAGEAEAEEPAESGNPYVRVTTRSMDRAQLGEKASAPVAKWKVEVIDPASGEPIPFTDDGKSEKIIEGPPLYNYMYLTKMLVPRIAEKLAEEGMTLDTSKIRGVVDRTAEMEDKLAIAQDAALDNFWGELNKLKGTDAYRYLTETKIAVSGVGNGEAMSPVSPWNMLREMKRHSVPLERIGIPSGQAERLKKLADVVASSIPDQADKIRGRRQSDEYWSDQFEQGLNLGGNLQSMYNYMLMDKDDPNRPLVPAWKNGQPVYAIEWSTFFDTPGPSIVRKRVHPSLDMPFLYAGSEESQNLLKELGLDDEALEKGRKEGKLDSKELAKRLDSLYTSLDNAYTEIFNPSSYVTLSNSEGETLIPAWDLIQKYQSTIAKSLGENWARFIRGSGSYGYKGGIGSQRLGPGSDVAASQYNPVLRDLFARAHDAAPWLVPILQNYYLTYGEEPFIPDESQIAGFLQQLGDKSGEAFEYLTDPANAGGIEGKTGFSKTSLGRVASDLLNKALLRPKEAADIIYGAPGGGEDDSGFKWESFVNLLNRLSPGSVVPSSDRKTGLELSGAVMEKLLGGKTASQVLESPEWRRLVIRAMMEEVFENPDIQARLADPTGFHMTHQAYDANSLGRRQHKNEQNLKAKGNKAIDEFNRQMSLVELGIHPRDLITDPDAFFRQAEENRKLYDLAIDRARRGQSRLAARIFDMLMNGDKNVKYKNGFGLYRDIFNPPSDKRIKRPAKRRKGVRPSFVERLASLSEASGTARVSDARAKEPSDWESWEARRRALVGEDR